MEQNKYPKFLKRNEWAKTPAIFTKKSLLVANHQVMQRWEHNYMKMLAGIVGRRGGDILEIGFGLGMSASFIQKYPKVKSHTVVEFHPDMIKHCKNLFNGKVKILKGFWEDILPKIKENSFDAVLFDPYPLSKEELTKTRYLFLKESYRFLKPGGVLTYYSDISTCKDFLKEYEKKLSDLGFSKIDCKSCKVSPPKDCTYYNKKTIIAPIVIK